MPDVVLATLNAKWEHASFGLRCLHAALGPLADYVVVNLSSPNSARQRSR